MTRFLPIPVGAFAFLALAFTTSSTAASPLEQESYTYFEKHIRPILVEHCYECHSEEAGKRKGGLWLDRKAGWEIGGDSGAALIPGDPEQSLMIHLVRYEDQDLEMPPTGKLPDDALAKLEAWVKMGAPDPRTEAGIARRKTMDVEAGRDFWSYKPITKPEPPSVDSDWGQGAIDRFLLAALEAKDLRPAPPASKEVLLRRATITLTGLPPTPAELDAFLADNSPDAFPRVVDRLLDSPEFAERWGRHWLDITRYADTSGGGRALTLGDAWRFRDYVIESFRKDKPLDQLIREHIAGDLLPSDSAEDRMEKLLGTAFLVLGPHNYENQDKETLDLEIVDEQVDTIGRAFMGMTIGCARCHDHKFDPIPTADYYAMAGIFTSTQSVQHSNVSKWHTRPYLVSAEQEQQYAAYLEAKERLDSEILDYKREIQALGGSVRPPKKDEPLKDIEGIILDNSDAEVVGEWEVSTSNPRYAGSDYLHDQDRDKGEKKVVYRLQVPESGRYEVRVSYSTGPNRAQHVPVTVENAGQSWDYRVDQRETPGHEQLFETLGRMDFQAEAEVVVTIGTKGAFGHVIADCVQILPEAEAGPNSPKGPQDEQLAKIDELRSQLAEAEKELKALNRTKPSTPTIMSVAEGTEIADTQIRIRGVTRNFGPEVPRGFLQVAWTGEGPPPVIPEDRSGRLALADWIVDANNPLTARVLANRIWLHLFGEGIVASPDNFGITGRAPTHPELLDYLAARLIEHDWSSKALIREIVLSDAWTMSGQNPAVVDTTVDPDNTLLWKFPQKRLDAETLRDSILMLAGNLDPEKGGPSLPKGFKSEFGYKFTSKKRSVYIPVFRNQLHEIFGAFDFANPNFVVGKRSQSNIPTQSLFLMNSPFMHQQSQAAAERLLAQELNNDMERMREAYRTFLCREPSPTELALSLDFLRAEQADSDSLTAWSGVIRTLYSCVDFQYIH